MDSLESKLGTNFFDQRSGVVVHKIGTKRSLESFSKVDGQSPRRLSEQVLRGKEIDVLEGFFLPQRQRSFVQLFDKRREGLHTRGLSGWCARSKHATMTRRSQKRFSPLWFVW